MIRGDNNKFSSILKSSKLLIKYPGVSFIKKHSLVLWTLVLLIPLYTTKYTVQIDFFFFV